MEKDGWKDGDPLGPQQRDGAITDPIELEGRNPKVKRGLGYHGEKLTRPSTSRDSSTPSTNHLPSKLNKLWGPRSGEPLASHSPFFPQFAFNLPNNRFKERTTLSRTRATPGPDDGIVITTAYDRPLQIDSEEELLRSKNPNALKHRTIPSAGNSQSAPSLRHSIATEGLKYQKRLVERSTPFHLSAVKFVKGGVLDEKR